MTDVTTGTDASPQPARKPLSDATTSVEAKPFGEGTASTVGAEPAGATSGASEPGILVSGVGLAQAKAGEAREWASQQKDVLASKVRDNPIGSSAIVFGAGVLLGLLLNRR